MPGDPELERTLDAIEADLDAVELALAELEADATEIDLGTLERDAEPGRLAEQLARQRAATATAAEEGQPPA